MIIEDILKSLDNKYVIAGGYAINFHGFIRSTLDIDYFVIANNKKLKEIENNYLIKNDIKYKFNYVEENDFSEELGSLIRFNYNGIEYDLIQAKYNYQIDGVNNNVNDENGRKYLNLYYLILFKISAGSGKDISDIIALLKINNIDIFILKGLIKKYNFDKRFPKEVEYILKQV